MALDTAGYTPIFRISKDDIDITTNFEDRVTEITVESYSGGGNGDKLTLELDDRNWDIVAPITAPGQESIISIALGYKEVGLFDQGSFVIDTIVYSGMPKKMTLMGVSQGFTTAAKSMVIVNHQDTTLGAIANKIAQAAGAQLAISSSLAGRAIQYLNQRESAYHLAQKIERDHNALIKFQDGIMSVTERNSGQSASGQSLNGFTLEPPDLATWSIKETNRTAFSHVRSSYWDKTKHQVQWLTSSVLGLIGGPPHMIVKQYPSQEEAQYAANSYQDALNRSIKSGTLSLTKGNASIRGGAPFSIAGTRDGMDGDYIVNIATHSLTKENGLTTTLQFDQGTGGSVSDNVSNDDTPDFLPSQTQFGKGGIGRN